MNDFFKKDLAENFEAKDLAEIFEAISFAASRHVLQKRKDSIGTPYINHPLNVAKILAFVGESKTTIIGGIIHDVVEDTNTTLNEIKIRFGDEVADLVSEVTNKKELSGDESKLFELERAKSLTSAASAIRIADKYENVGDINLEQPIKWPIERKLNYITWAKNLVDNIQWQSYEPVNRLKCLFYLRFFEKLNLFK